AQEEAVVITATVDVPANDLARVVDPLCKGTIGAQGIVERGVGAARGIVEEAVDLTLIKVVSDDLSCIVDTLRKGATRARRQRIIEGGVVAAAVEKAVIAAGVGVKPHDL